MPEIIDRPTFSDEYLKDFVRMHEYRLQSRISQARANRLWRKLKNRSYPLIRA